jgi:hypothetical protein
LNSEAEGEIFRSTGLEVLLICFIRLGPSELCKAQRYER